MTFSVGIGLCLFFNVRDDGAVLFLFLIFFGCVLYFWFDRFTALRYFFISSLFPAPEPLRLKTARNTIKIRNAIPIIIKRLIIKPPGFLIHIEIGRASCREI